MSLTPGASFGPYEIIGPLGAGGMGAVYRARDSKLNRDVAIKVLLPEFAGDPDRLARFRREAQLLAALNHSSIGHIYGLYEGQEGHLRDGQDTVGLVLEYVDGPTLADLLASILRYAARRCAVDRAADREARKPRTSRASSIAI